MTRVQGYTEAVAVLTGRDSAVVAALDRVAGGALLTGAALGVPGMLELLEAKSLLAQLGQDAVRSLRERRSGTRATRTQRLHAAQEVLVVTAFFAVLAEADLPFRFTDLELTESERAALVPRPAPQPRGGAEPSGVWPVFDGEDPVAFFRSGVQARQALTDRYRAAAEGIERFVAGLAVWDTLSDTDRSRFRTALRAVPDRAVERYVELFRQLCGDVGEAAAWATQLAAQDLLAGVGQARTDVAGLRGHLDRALAAMELRLVEAATGRAPDARREALARAYRAALDRPIADRGDDGAAATGPVLPSLGEGYLAPAFRTCRVGAEPYRGGRDRLSDEDWWALVPVQQDLDAFLARYLTSPAATVAPLLVLGQPGSGKSVLTKVLAARLPANDYLVVRVALRDVHAAGGVQDQIEQAVRADTGERLDWPDLARSAGDAMPVVLLDGFDELIQATGVAQTDYLVRVAAFQRREADQGRPLAVMVTTRTSVANRATAPDDSVAVRLEPFDGDRVAAWTAVWNRVNAGWFAGAGLAPLAPEAVLDRADLAGQPLLLLMLALYDAEENALQAGGDGLGEGELYERLLRSFARREVGRERPGAAPADVDRAVERELQRLSVVAFAMFNRGVQWIGEAELDADLRALPLFASPAAGTGPDLRSPVRESSLLVGRFFFVHRSRASTADGGQLATYEFLHATFGEYLVARLTWRVLTDLDAREAASTLGLGTEPVDDDLLYALLSFAAFSARPSVVRFLAGLAGTTGAAAQPAVRARLADLAVRLFQLAAGQAVRRERYVGYLPRRAAAPARYAAHTANLLVLVVCLAGETRASRLFPEARDPVEEWHALALVWRAHLNVPEGWSSLVELLALERLGAGDRRDVRVTLDDGTFVTPPVDVAWTYADPPDAGTLVRYHHPQVVRRKAHFLCGHLDDVVLHAVEPLTDAVPEAFSTYQQVDGDRMASLAQSLLHAVHELWTAGEEDHEAAYERFRSAYRAALVSGI